MNRILIASVLKPVNDPRMYEKFGISISRLEGTEVHICGYREAGSWKKEEGRGGKEDTDRKIAFHPIFEFNRLSFDRVFAPFKFLGILLKVKPQVIIVTTFELLIVTILYRILFGGKILYDIQENYYRNIRFNQTYPPVIRTVLALYTRTMEYLSIPFISHCLLAERNYEQEFSFSKGKSLVIENKYQKQPGEKDPLPRPKPLSKGPIRLLYSGTISEEYGIFEAINLAEKLHEIHPGISLTIIGYCANKQTLNYIKERIESKDFIQLTGGEDLVSHELILEEIRKADFGLLSYRPNKSTENCIPTRLFEYQAQLLPMIIAENKLWEQICAPNTAAIFIHYKSFHPAHLLQQLTETTFYPAGLNPDVFWTSEEIKLQDLIKSYLK
ncbi:MAG: glycosyltransferase [Cytophagaceae bacterium]